MNDKFRKIFQVRIAAVPSGEAFTLSECAC